MTAWSDGKLAPLAQTVEHLHGKQKVCGSIPQGSFLCKPQRNLWLFCIFKDMERIVIDKPQILNKEVYITDTLKNFLDTKITAYANNIKNDDLKNKRSTAIGKWGEFFAVATLTKDFGFPMIVPYLKRHEWNRDLPYSKIDLSLPDIVVKTCNEYTLRNYGLSWMFQNDDEDKYLDKNTLVVCMYVEDNIPAPSDAVLVATIPLCLVRNKLREPVSQKFRNKRKILYIEDIK